MSDEDAESGDDVVVARNSEANRYEIRVGAALAGFAAYRPGVDRLVFTHTEIDPAFEGRGLGSRLATEALDDVRRRGLKLVPQCPFIRAFIDQHPAYADLVA
ncbi:MAG TPA: GNAT family N-acetyltransferase [Acidimicrobiales bacterium]